MNIVHGALFGLVILLGVSFFVSTYIDVPYVWVDASGYCLRAEDGRGLDVPCEVARNDPTHIVRPYVAFYHK